MHTHEHQPVTPPVTGIVRWTLRRADRTLAITGLFFLACALPTGVLAIIDQRTLDGFNVWLKPLKFQVSITFFLVTLACMTSFTRAGFRRSFWGRATVWTAVSTSVFEIAWITYQAGMGERSHYNQDGAFGSGMYTAMGVAAVALSLTPVSIAVATMTNRTLDAAARVARWGLCLGAFASLVGAAGVGMMLGAEPAHYPTPDSPGDPRVPIAGWSTTEGDLRIAHFIGLHALQGLFVMGLALCAIKANPRLAKAALAIIGIAWIAATIALAQMASQGNSPLWFLTSVL